MHSLRHSVYNIPKRSFCSSLPSQNPPYDQKPIFFSTPPTPNSCTKKLQDDAWCDFKAQNPSLNRWLIPPLLLFCNIYNSVACTACSGDWVVYEIWQDALRIVVWSGSAHVPWAAGALHCAAIICGALSFFLARLLGEILRSQPYSHFI